MIITEITDSLTINNIEKICIKNNHGFIYTRVCDLFSFIFDDLGENHSISNWNGKSPKYYYIKNTTKDKECLITKNDQMIYNFPMKGIS